ncbi:MAG: hypothetical protein EA358_09110 [Flavobacteriales bacterium]|nr:MAG: hypothetical protein EA358_09110 [Flavobacteriales bacterium]
MKETAVFWRGETRVLLDSGTNIRYIQGLLGHKSITNTTIYTYLTDQKVRKISSSLDDLGLDKSKK